MFVNHVGTTMEKKLLKINHKADHKRWSVFFVYFIRIDYFIDRMNRETNGFVPNYKRTILLVILLLVKLTFLLMFVNNRKCIKIISLFNHNSIMNFMCI